MFEKLDQIKPALKDLVKELRKKYAYASVLAVEDDNRGWRISRTGKRINSQGFGGGSGYVVRVFDQVGCAEYSFNEFSEEKIPDLYASFFVAFIFLILLSLVNYVTIKAGETVRRGRNM